MFINTSPLGDIINYVFRSLFFLTHRYKKNGSQIDWTRLINDIYSAVNVNITEDEQVIVVEIGYLFKFLGLIDETPPRVLGNRSDAGMHIPAPP